MRLAALLLALVLMVPAAFAAAPQAGARPDHVADRDCLACHPDQAGAWAESKHRHAMQPATAQTVLGDFGDVRFGEGAAAARFFRRGGDFVVAAQGADGRTQELAASHVFGIRPLPADDPTQRRPDIELAKSRLGWTPKVALDEGLGKTIAYFDALLSGRLATA